MRFADAEKGVRTLFAGKGSDSPESFGSLAGLTPMDTVTLTLGSGEVLLDRLLEEGVEVTHECGGKLACSTCQVVVREGMEHLSAISEGELDMLDRASD